MNAIINEPISNRDPHKFDSEHADDGYDDDLAYEQSREAGAL